MLACGHECDVYFRSFMRYCVLICSIHFFIHDIMCYYVLLMFKFENYQNKDKILSIFLIFFVKFSFEYVPNQ
jgi:hypothetical protein